MAKNRHPLVEFVGSAAKEGSTEALLSYPTADSVTPKAFRKECADIAAFFGITNNLDLVIQCAGTG